MGPVGPTRLNLGRLLKFANFIADFNLKGCILKTWFNVVPTLLKTGPARLKMGPNWLKMGLLFKIANITLNIHFLIYIVFGKDFGLRLSQLKLRWSGIWDD